MDRTVPDPTLLEATRTVARGGGLETELEALAGYVLAATDARAAAVYLFDPIGERLVPAAAAGIDAQRFASADTIIVDDERELAARVALERQPLTTADGLSAGLFEGLARVPLGVIGLPLVAADVSGREDVEGVLLAAYDGEPPDPSATENPLPALADLCAVAIRTARLANALVERSEWIERLASTDALTGLANATTFERMLELEIARATRMESQLSLVLFDVDGMAGINEREGAAAGDDVLRRLASLLADEVRVVDTVGRLGADDFGLIAPGGGGAIVAERVRNAAAKMRTRGGSSISLRAAAVVFPANGGSTTELMAAASTALEKARA